jgi:hypothetical protein
MTAIMHRREIEDNKQRSWIEWQTKALSQMLVVTAGYPVSSQHMLFAEVDKISMRPSATDSTEDDIGMEGRDWYWAHGEKIKFRFNDSRKVRTQLHPGLVTRR